MKKIITYSVTALLASAVISSSCSKEKEGEDNQNADCRTCKAFANGIQPEITKEVCGEQAMNDFRAQNPGREISCY